MLNRAVAITRKCAPLWDIKYTVGRYPEVTALLFLHHG